MARVTVEDCLAYVENAFELVLRASVRARELQRGEAEPLVSADNDKPTVIALREIALGDEFIEALAKRKAEAAALERKGYEDYQDPVSLSHEDIFKDADPKKSYTEVFDEYTEDILSKKEDQTSTDVTEAEEKSAAEEAIDAEDDNYQSNADNVAKQDKGEAAEDDNTADTDTDTDTDADTDTDK